MSGNEATQFSLTQNNVWTRQVLVMGDPNKLIKNYQKAQNASDAKAIFSMLGGAVLGGVIGSKLGSPFGAAPSASLGGQVGLTSGLMQNISPSISFSKLPEIDYSQYPTVDIRKVGIYKQHFGSMIIAYKTEKTPEIEQEALFAGIPVLLGFDETPEQVKQARQEDFEARMAVWNECVEAGKCKAE